MGSWTLVITLTSLNGKRLVWYVGDDTITWYIEDVTHMLVSCKLKTVEL